MITAAGAIYVIGGSGSGGTTYQDVWVSTDGARPGLRQQGRTRGVLKGYSRGTQGYSGGI